MFLALPLQYTIIPYSHQGEKNVRVFQVLHIFAESELDLFATNFKNQWKVLVYFVKKSGKFGCQETMDSQF